MSYLTEHPSPDGKYHILLAANEIRMSLWIESAALWRSGDTRALLSIGDDMWSADTVTWSADSAQVTLAMRRYPGDTPGITVTLFPERSEAMVVLPDQTAETVPFAKLSSHMDACYNRLRKR